MPDVFTVFLNKDDDDDDDEKHNLFCKGGRVPPGFAVDCSWVGSDK